jgi:Amt family ammonium transporter
MTFAQKFAASAGAAGLALFAALPAWAQDAAAAPASVVDKGDTAWMMTSTVLVLAMILPGLALFYGGLTRTKNMLSTMTQIGAAACLAMIVWVCYGYGLAFGPEGNAFIAWGKFFLSGVTPARKNLPQLTNWFPSGPNAMP